MKPFTAWLAMSVTGSAFLNRQNNRYLLCPERDTAALMPETEPQRVLIVADTPENRKKLGMEE